MYIKQIENIFFVKLCYGHIKEVWLSGYAIAHSTDSTHRCKRLPWLPVFAMHQFSKQPAISDFFLVNDN